jgi:selenocysteine lyase/cysteine desulfurase
MELLLDIGIENIATELLRKRSLLVPELQKKGFAVLQADAGPQHASGIVSFFNEQADLGQLHQRLESSGIITSLRSDRSGRKYLRLSPHFYNTDAELHRLLEQL